MKVWINADGGSDKLKMSLAKALEEKGISVFVGKPDVSAHYADYFNVTSDYKYYITIYNGFCAGTIREAYSREIQDMLKEKGVTLMVVFDTELWLEGMRPYRFGDFSGYHAKRAWDDNFSEKEPDIEDVRTFLMANNAIYCAGPDAQTIMEQFETGGYFEWEKQHK